MVLIVSHPAALDTVSVIDAGVLKMCPNIVAGNPLAQTAVSTVFVSNGNDVTVIVLIVSHPATLETVSVTAPGALKMCPKIVAGNAFAQTAVSTVFVSNGNEFTLIVLIVSHPTALETVSVIDEGALNT